MIRTVLFTSLVGVNLLLLLAPPRIERIAGGGTGNDGGKATQAKLVEPFGVGFDHSGNMYIVQMEGGERVRKVNRSGIITTVAGTGVKGFSGDNGPAVNAQINGSHHLLVLPDGDILLADTWNNRVRQIDHRTGIIATIAGTGKPGFAGDNGPATHAQFGGIYCLALSPKNDRLYLCDLDNRRIRMVNRKTGIVTTVAGNGQQGVPWDGQEATAAPLVDPRAITVDPRGNLYILERGGNALRVVDTQGKIRTLIGPNVPQKSSDIGVLNGPKHLCADQQGNIFIADTENHRILKYVPRTGRMERIAGTGKEPPKEASTHDDLKGSPLEMQLNRPHGVFVRPDGSLYIADSSNDRVICIKP